MGKHESKSERTGKDSGHNPTHSREHDSGLSRTLNRLKDEANMPIPGIPTSERRSEGKHGK